MKYEFDYHLRMLERCAQQYTRSLLYKRDFIERARERRKVYSKTDSHYYFLLNEAQHWQEIAQSWDSMKKDHRKNIERMFENAYFDGMSNVA